MSALAGQPAPVGERPGEPVVRARGLVKEFPGRRAVDGIDFDVWPGEIFGFLGPNGAGKSSTLRMLYGVSPVTAGSLHVVGRDITREARAVKARLGVVPQENNLDGDLTVRQNLLVYARYFDIDRREAGRRADEILDLFQLTDRSGSRVEDLSGGMKRRLIIGRALINQPDLVVLDEPTTGLDPQARLLVWEKLRFLNETGVTLVLTTHYMDEAAQLCGRLVVMDGGRILREGAPADLVQQEVGRAVAELRVHPDDLDPVRGALAAAGARLAALTGMIYLFGDDEATLRQQVAPVAERLRAVAYRPATLEDLFLTVTGHALSE